jgi:hypothetical protein
VLCPKIKVVDLVTTDLIYAWEAKSEDSGWEEISASRVLLLYQKLAGKIIRLSCRAPGRSK